ncbi:hypothetical protein BU16DRAFT_370887 [Lophium mytilinum]|uniref:Uncharacterized protein n=1 Tax=Lophium mytilinum TaxID=390894 RepID=A0A6A6QWJ1_9PEZI|nr:hypothetical protein BU16DRAFT_370887 [Lophium mytilinum]
MKALRGIEGPLETSLDPSLARRVVGRDRGTGLSPRLHLATAGGHAITWKPSRMFPPAVRNRQVRDSSFHGFNEARHSRKNRWLQHGGGGEGKRNTALAIKSQHQHRDRQQTPRAHPSLPSTCSCLAKCSISSVDTTSNPDTRPTRSTGPHHQRRRPKVRRQSSPCSCCYFGRPRRGPAFLQLGRSCSVARTGSAAALRRATLQLVSITQPNAAKITGAMTPCNAPSASRQLRPLMIRLYLLCSGLRRSRMFLSLDLLKWCK